ncbi:MAG: thioredoxin family protein [Bacteroidota bacterium]
MKKLLYPLISIALLISCSPQEEKRISFEGIQNFDFTNSLAQAKTKDKKLLIYFSGETYENCHYMEKAVLADPEVVSAILQDYMFIMLMVDDMTMAEEQFWRYGRHSHLPLKRVGDINMEYQYELTRAGSNPIFTIVSEDEKTQAILGFTNDKGDFLAFLKKNRASL